VFDVARNRLLEEELVAHGRGSGEYRAVRFANDAESHASSLGLFVTRDTYVGGHGLSLRLDGLEPGVNDRARDRLIVLHGAPYVSREFASAKGRLGLSWGCPAVEPRVAARLIDRIRDGAPLFVYYPDPRWLASSPFLSDCADAAETARR
jgi:hypothetical protein